MVNIPTPIIHNLATVEINALTLNVKVPGKGSPRLNTDSPLGVQPTTEDHLAPNGIDTFQRLWYPLYRTNKQTKKTNWYRLSRRPKYGPLPLQPYIET